MNRAFSARALAFTAVVSVTLGGGLGYIVATGSGGAVTEGPGTATAIGSPSPPGPLAIGETAITKSGSTVTVLGWQEKAPGWEAAGKGSKLRKVWVRFCSGPAVTSFGVRQIPQLFSVIDSEGVPTAGVTGYSSGQLDELNSYVWGKLAPSTCITGSIIFNTADDVYIETVQFTGNSQHEWDVSAASSGSSPVPIPSISPGISPAPITPAS